MRDCWVGGVERVEWSAAICDARRAAAVGGIVAGPLEGGVTGSGVRAASRFSPAKRTPGSRCGTATVQGQPVSRPRDQAGRVVDLA